jgi:hypothetical protein
MIMSSIRTIRTTDTARSAWSGLRQFHNVAFVTDRLSDLHKIPTSQKRNARKQAEQIRFCLMQAREYHDAARVVSAVTKPVLLYYSLMNLATAEALFKQTGASSIDKAREQHRHHGLVFSVRSPSTGSVNVAEAASRLSAVPAIRGGGERYGTFELWRRSAGSHPMIANGTTQDGSRTLQSFYAFAVPRDDSLAADWKKISLLDCLKCLPALSDLCRLSGIVQELVRAGLHTTNNVEAKSGSLTVLIHPHAKEVYEKVIERITVRPDCLERVAYLDNGDHGRLIYSWDENYPLDFALPSSFHIYRDECLLHSDKVDFNEFGFYYLSLYMCSNYARYYPDFWIKDVEESSYLFSAVDEVIRTAEDRVPLHTLSELERNYIVLER